MEFWHWLALFAIFYVGTGFAYFGLLRSVDGIGEPIRGGPRLHAVLWPASVLGFL